MPRTTITKKSMRCLTTTQTEKFESKKKKKKKDEEEDVKRVSDDDRLKEMMGEDAFSQVREVLATFESNILSEYEESMREFKEQIGQK